MPDNRIFQSILTTYLKRHNATVSTFSDNMSAYTAHFFCQHVTLFDKTDCNQNPVLSFLFDYA